MTPFKNHNHAGFTFIEVVLTVALISSVLMPVFMVQYNVLQFLSRSSDNVRALFLIDALFSYVALESEKEEETKTFEKKYEDPALNTSYEVEPVPEQSSLKQWKHLFVARSQGAWQRAGVKERQQEVSFLFKPPQEKEGKGTT